MFRRVEGTRSGRSRPDHLQALAAVRCRGRPPCPPRTRGLPRKSAKKACTARDERQLHIVHDGEEGRNEEQRQEASRPTRPPMTAIAMGERNSAPAPRPSALGTMPAIIAIVVMMIGRARFLPASTIAFVRGMPRRHRRDGREVDDHDRILGDDAHQHQNADDHRHAERPAGDRAARGWRRRSTAAARTES